MSRKIRKNSNIGRKFILYVKVYDSDGFLIEKKSGWLLTSPKVHIHPTAMKRAFEFTEKEEGHGSYSDWKKFFEDEHRNWRIEPPQYTT